ncbi:MAG: hypothetical protein K0R17_2239 [Rariglobus sp.]|nr:hypothetical protein [Rariglobus sp.]
MIFGRAIPFREALASQEARRWLPTGLGSVDLAKLDADLLRRSMFSAKVADFAHLDEVGTGISDVLSGRLDVATARLRIKQHLWRTGYQAPPEKEGGLEDFASDRRVNLQIETNVEMMRGLGNHIQGQQEDVLDMWPAQELVRVIDSRDKRDWNKRWLAAGGPRTDAWPRMIALKTDPVWVALSRFRNPYPPFDWGSGMGLEDRTRREAMALGLIDLNTRLFPDRVTGDINRGVQATHAVQDKRLKAALEKSGIGRFDESGVFVLVDTDNGGPLLNREYMRDENGRFASKDAGALAVEALLSTKGDVMGAMSRPETGPIDFRWGKEGDAAKDFAGGHGFAKIVAKHGAEQARLTPEIIADGEITFNGPARMVIKHKGHTVVLVKDFFGEKSNHWVLSSHDTSHGSKAGGTKEKGNR